MHMTCRKPGLGCGELSRWPGAAALATWREPGEGLRTRLLDSGILTLPLAGEGFHVELPIGWPHRQRRTGGRVHPSLRRKFARIRQQILVVRSVRHPNLHRHAGGHRLDTVPIDFYPAAHREPAPRRPTDPRPSSVARAWWAVTRWQTVWSIRCHNSNGSNLVRRRFTNLFTGLRLRERR